MIGTAILFATVLCPPDVGQIKWSGFSFTFSAGGREQTVEGTLWDRDRNGKPSKGDLFRVDEGEKWFVVGGDLAQRFAARFKQVGDGLAAACESRFDVEGVPTVTTTAGLAALLDEGGGGRQDPVARLQGQMRAWAEEICGQKKHYEEAQLAEILVQRAAGERGFKGSTLRREAQMVAREFGLKCAHIAVPKMTFD